MEKSERGDSFENESGGLVPNPNADDRSSVREASAKATGGLSSYSSESTPISRGNAPPQNSAEVPPLSNSGSVPQQPLPPILERQPQTLSESTLQPVMPPLFLSLGHYSQIRDSTSSMFPHSIGEGIAQPNIPNSMVSIQPDRTPEQTGPARSPPKTNQRQARAVEDVESSIQEPKSNKKTKHSSAYLQNISSHIYGWIDATPKAWEIIQEKWQDMEQQSIENQIDDIIVSKGKTPISLESFNQFSHKKDAKALKLRYQMIAVLAEHYIITELPKKKEIISSSGNKALEEAEVSSLLACLREFLKKNRPKKK